MALFFLFDRSYGYNLTHSYVFQRQAAAKAEDLHQNGIEVELMHINGPQGAFDTSVFYKVSVMMLHNLQNDTALSQCFIFFISFIMVSDCMLCCLQDILFQDDDDTTVKPDPVERFDELLNRFALQ